MKQTSSAGLTLERFGLEAIPQQQRQTTALEYMIMQIAFSVNAGNFLVPALAVLEGGLSFIQAIIATVFGALVAFLLVSALSLPGGRYGLPAQYSIRAFLGSHGARVISSPIRTITSLYWFSVQTIGGTYLLIHILERIFQAAIPFWPLAFLISTSIATLAVIGFNAVKRVLKLFLPILIFGQAVLLFLFIRELNASDVSILTEGDRNIKTMAFFASLAFVQYVSGVSAAADMARYAKTSKHAFWGLFAGNSMGFILTAGFGAFSAAFFATNNPFIAGADITSSPFIIFIIFIMAMVSMISINLNNAYTGGFSLLNTFPALGRINSAIVFGALGVGLSMFPTFVNEAKQYISLLGALIIPLSSVIVTDYLLCKKGALSEQDLANIAANQYKLNFVALTVIVLGTALYMMIPEEYAPGFLTFLIVGICYFTIKIRK
ncbi:cytosine permease [Bacillus sp. HMF5848]|uniref:purine-cytosine permease family protein n=1 Tax=Bacillus sp. HMF5848 TaxID=2495421 RepID=UPI000F7A91EE|nr:cytosine permease [Bacillus sp. HMF5848]RSK28158.1 cytosine permease [Bacillus sp. HMF5848]